MTVGTSFSWTRYLIKKVILAIEQLKLLILIHFHTESLIPDLHFLIPYSLWPLITDIQRESFSSKSSVKAISFDSGLWTWVKYISAKLDGQPALSALHDIPHERKIRLKTP